jgi:hypothetical protein
MERSEDPDAVRLRSVFDAYDFCVSTSGPTHCLGGTLDIVAARVAVPLTVTDVDISDHYLISWPVEIDSSQLRPFPVCSRPWRRLDLGVFRSALSSSAICQPHLCPLDVDAAALLYGDIINEILDHQLPAVRSTRCPRPSDPWFDSECRSAKRQTRRLERAAAAAYSRSTASGSTEDVTAAANTRAVWFVQRRVYRQLRHRKCREFWSNEFVSTTDPRRIWSTVDRLLGRGRRACDLVSADDLCDFFVSKVERIRASTSGSAPPTFTNAPDDVRLCVFDNVLSSDVEATIARLPDKSSSADVLPVKILKLVADISLHSSPSCLIGRSTAAAFLPALRTHSSRLF